MKELIAAIELARPNFGPITKNKRAPYGMYADLESVVAAVETPLIEQGVSITHFGARAGDMEFLVTKLTHWSTNEHIDSYFPLPRMGDSRGTSAKGTSLFVSPQDVGGAMTYGKRYNLVALLNLQTESDDDGNTTSQREPAPQEPQTFVATAQERAWMKALQGLLTHNEKPTVPQSKLRQALMRHKVLFDDSRKEFTGITEDIYRIVDAEMNRLKKEILEKK